MLVSLSNLHSELYATAGYPAITVPLGLRATGLLMVGYVPVVIVLLLLSFGPVDMSRLPLLFTNSQNMRQFGVVVVGSRVTSSDHC